MIRNTVILLLFSVVWKLSESTDCYKCEPKKEMDASRVCQYFEQTGQYIKQCPLSTMCYKKIVHLDMPDGSTTTSIQRDCAAQTEKDEQKRVNGKWRFTNTVHEVYEEKCIEEAREGFPTRTIHCYCRGHLCNSADAPLHDGPLIGVVFLIIFSLFS